MKTGAKKSGQNVPAWLDDETVEQIDRLAQKIGITRSRMVANLVGIGLEDALFLEKSGILPVALALKKFKNLWRNCGLPDLTLLKKELS